jgi:cell wall-associated NlpC family hydrolase
MAWWANTVTGAIASGAGPPDPVIEYTGPFATRADAAAWLAAHPPSGGSGGGGAPGGGKPTRGSKLTGALIARIARRYIGAGYVYGGNASTVGVWDCSSFVSYVLHQAGLSLPGGKWGDPGFPPNSHGPVVMSYVQWAGATTVGMPQAGDLCCYAGEGANGHIGIAVSGTRMVSALNPADGTLETDIFPPGAGQPLIYRRVNGLAGGVVAVASGQTTASHPPVVVAVVVAVMYLGAAALGLGLLAAGVAGVTRAARR